ESLPSLASAAVSNAYGNTWDFYGNETGQGYHNTHANGLGVDISIPAFSPAQRQQEDNLLEPPTGLSYEERRDFYTIQNSSFDLLYTGREGSNRLTPKERSVVLDIISFYETIDDATSEEMKDLPKIDRVILGATDTDFQRIKTAL